MASCLKMLQTPLSPSPALAPAAQTLLLSRRGPPRPALCRRTMLPPASALGDQIAAGVGALVSKVAGISIPDTIAVLPGKSVPLGPSSGGPAGEPGVNFALAAPNATAVSLCLYDAAGAPLAEAPMHRDGGAGVWHGFVPGLPPKGVLYGVRVSGEGGWETPFRWDPTRVLLDPYAPHVVGRAKFGVRDEFEQFQPKLGSRFLGTYDFSGRAFDWGAGYSRPRIPEQDLVILELPVRCFTADASSGLAPARRGTYLGLADKIPHLVEMGVNAVELLPVFEYDELEFQRRPNPRDHMTNVWGYSHLSFFSPMARFGSSTAAGGARSDPVATAEEFKEMVRRLHAAGIEVILDVVYNHTAEGETGGRERKRERSGESLCCFYIYAPADTNRPCPPACLPSNARQPTTRTRTCCPGAASTPRSTTSRTPRATSAWSTPLAAATR